MLCQVLQGAVSLGPKRVLSTHLVPCLTRFQRSQGGHAHYPSKAAPPYQALKNVEERARGDETRMPTIVCSWPGMARKQVTGARKVTTPDTVVP